MLKMEIFDDIDEVVEQMTLEEKARLVNGSTFFGSFGLERLRIPRLQLLDGGTGINFEQLFGDMTEYYGMAEEMDTSLLGSTMLFDVIEYFFEPERLTEEERPLYHRICSILAQRLSGKAYSPGCFPPGILLGATWNPEVVYEVGEALGMEACLFGVHILLGSPNVNIHRDPLNGRLFEGYSEDPCLVGKLAPELVKGVQKYGVAANVKHFAANNQETNRVGINERISLRALEEIYFPGFKACVKEGGVKTLMNAYNQINDLPCTENEWLLREKLRDEWGFEGMVLSDWGAVYHPVEALAAGTELAMPGPLDYRPIAEAVADGSLAESHLNEAVSRILHVIKWIGEHYRENIGEELGLDEIRRFTDRAAYHAACEGIVMLKNDGTFPIGTGMKVLITGSGAKGITECGAGSAGIHTDRTSSLYACLSDYLGKGNVELGDWNPDCIDRYGLGLCVCSLGGMEGNDRKDLKLSAADRKVLRELADKRQKTAIILNTCGPVELGSMDAEHVCGIFEMFLPGMEGGHAMADILVGRVNPSGKLPLTFPKRYEDTPTCMNFPGDGYQVHYGEGIYVGYRYYDRKGIEPEYAFGYGLSYTSFDCRLTDAFFDEKKKKLHIGVCVKNTGACAGSEVVQIYISDPYSTLSKPKKELKEFCKLALAPGEEKEADFSLDVEELASYDSDISRFVVEEGYYDVIAAVSSREEDIFGTKRIYVDVLSPYSYSVNSMVKVIYEHEELRETALRLWREQGFDTEIINNNYRYTPGRRLTEAMGDLDPRLATEEKCSRFKQAFNEAAKKIRKK